MRQIAKMLIPRTARHALRSCFDADFRDRRAWARDRELGHLIHGRTGGVVVGGPFRGVRYVDNAIGSTLAPKLLGTYELEVAGAVEQIVARGYGTVINLGAGEGYYAIGLARRMPRARVICFEAAERTRAELRRMAALNHDAVGGRLDVRGACDAEGLASALSEGDGDAVVVCDIEGAEMEVLRPDRVPALVRRADVLLETHDGYRPGVSRAMRARFGHTHHIQTFWSRRRTRADWPAGVERDPRWRACLDEGRGKMSWLWMTRAT